MFIHCRPFRPHRTNATKFRCASSRILNVVKITSAMCHMTLSSCALPKKSMLCAGTRGRCSMTVINRHLPLSFACWSISIDFDWSEFVLVILGLTCATHSHRGGCWTPFEPTPPKYGRKFDKRKRRPILSVGSKGVQPDF